MRKPEKTLRDEAADASSNLNVKRFRDKRHDLAIRFSSGGRKIEIRVLVSI
jgi:hypothetical protein